MVTDGRIQFTKWRGGRDSNIIPPVGTRDWKQKTRPNETRFLEAGRAGFEPATGFKAGTHLAGEPIQPLWHLPNCMGSSDLSRTWTVAKAVTTDEPGGGSGIRTHVGVTQTCFQDMRLQPLGHPSRRKRFYHRVGIIETHD